MRVAIVGAGLAGMATAVDLVDAGHEVEMFESRAFVGGKVGSWVDADGNHIEMGLHVFFNNYANLGEKFFIGARPTCSTIICSY